MALKNDRFTYRVTWSEDDDEYVGLCAESGISLNRGRFYLRPSHCAPFPLEG